MEKNRESLRGGGEVLRIVMLLQAFNPGQLDLSTLQLESLQQMKEQPFRDRWAICCFLFEYFLRWFSYFNLVLLLSLTITSCSLSQLCNLSIFFNVLLQFINLSVAFVLIRQSTVSNEDGDDLVVKETQWGQLVSGIRLLQNPGHIWAQEKASSFRGVTKWWI